MSRDQTTEQAAIGCLIVAVSCVFTISLTALVVAFIAL